MLANFIVARTIAALMAGAGAAPAPAPDVPLLAICARRVGHPHAEITLVAAFEGAKVVTLDAAATPLPALLRAAKPLPRFGVSPGGNPATVPGTTFLEHLRIDGDGDAQHLRLGPCAEPGTLYATRRLTAVAPQPGDRPKKAAGPGAAAAPIVNRVRFEGHLLTWVVEQTDVSAACTVTDGDGAPLRIEIEALGC